MRKIKKDLDSILSLEQKKQILREINQEDLLHLFKDGYTPTYKPARQKKSPLDQQISISLTAGEKEKLAHELKEIRKVGPRVSISSFVRSRAISDVDIEEWAERAVDGLRAFTTKEYDMKFLGKEKRKYLKLLDEAEDEDREDRYFYSKELDKINKRLEDIKRKSAKRKYRMNGRVTFNEAQHIRWRAAKLNIPIADYVRFCIFGYLPFSEDDSYMTLDSRKRFYISILDIQQNGWGDPPQLEECSNCQRYLQEIRDLREQLLRYQKLSGI